MDSHGKWQNVFMMTLTVCRMLSGRSKAYKNSEERQLKTSQDAGRVDFSEETATSRLPDTQRFLPYEYDRSTSEVHLAGLW